MIGLGIWELSVNTIFFKGTGRAEIIDNGGEYDFRLTLPERFKEVKVSFRDITEKNGDTLCGKAEISLFPGKIFEGEFTFTESTANGFVKVPMFGGKKLELKNGRKIG